MSQDALKHVYAFSYAESAKTFLILLSKGIEQFMNKGWDQQISIKDSIEWIYELFGEEIRRAAHISDMNYLKNASERLDESKEHFQREEIDDALLRITKAISFATTQASRALEAIEREI